jgi:hypothetical protein
VGKFEYNLFIALEHLRYRVSTRKARNWRSSPAMTFAKRNALSTVQLATSIKSTGPSRPKVGRRKYVIRDGRCACSLLMNQRGTLEVAGPSHAASSVAPQTEDGDGMVVLEA